MRKLTRAVTMVEMMAAMFILLMCMAVLVPLVRTTGVVFNKGYADQQTKDLLAQAALKIAPTLRNTLQVDIANTSAHKLTVMLPLVDPVSKGYVTPMQSGDSIAFYLSDKTGNPTHTGTIFWRSVNGTPDSNWSLRSGHGALDFGTSNLSFALDNASNPGVVTMTAYSTVWAGSKPKSATVSTSILLRNHKVLGP